MSSSPSLVAQGGKTSHTSNEEASFSTSPALKGRAMAKFVRLDTVAVVGDETMLEEALAMMTSRMAVKVDQGYVFISEIGKGKSSGFDLSIGYQNLKL